MASGFNLVRINIEFHHVRNDRHSGSEIFIPKHSDAQNQII